MTYVKPLSKEREHRLSRVLAQRQSGITVVIEDMYDPHNAAAVLRTCDGLGISDVHVIFDKQERYNLKKVGKLSSSTANKWIRIHEYTSTKECLEQLKKDGYVLVASAIDETSEDFYTASFLDKKIAIIVGNERTGISSAARSLADRVMHIPMKGFVESLNVSVFTAIVLYEVIRQRIVSGDPYRWNATEKKELEEYYHQQAS